MNQQVDAARLSSWREDQRCLSTSIVGKLCIIHESIATSTCVHYIHQCTIRVTTVNCNLLSMSSDSSLISSDDDIPCVYNFRLVAGVHVCAQVTIVWGLKHDLHYVILCDVKVSRLHQCVHITERHRESKVLTRVRSQLGTYKKRYSQSSCPFHMLTRSLALIDPERSYLCITASYVQLWIRHYNAA